jgi:hypothetical protein
MIFFRFIACTLLHFKVEEAAQSLFQIEDAKVLWFRGQQWSLAWPRMVFPLALGQDTSLIGCESTMEVNQIHVLAVTLGFLTETSVGNTLLGCSQCTQGAWKRRMPSHAHQ